MSKEQIFIEEPPEKLPKKRGRPKGSPKVPGSGRKKGTKNWTNSEIRGALLDKSDAIDVLADLVAGRQLYAGTSGSVGKPGWRYPTLQQRLQALQILLAKVIPDLKSAELTGADGKPLIPGKEPTTQGLALAVMAVLQDGNVDPALALSMVSDAPVSSPVAALEGEVSDVASSAFDASPDIAMGGACGRGDDVNRVPLSNISEHPSDGLSENSAPLENSGSEKIGTQIPIGNRGAKIVPVETASGVRKYAIYDFADELHSFRIDRLDAEELARSLPGIPGVNRNRKGNLND